MRPTQPIAVTQTTCSRWGGVRIAIPEDCDGVVLRTEDRRGGRHEMFLPPGIRCDIVARKATASFSFDRPDVVTGRVGWMARTRHQLGYRFTSKRKYVFVYPTHWIFPVDSGSRKRLSNIMGFLYVFNVDLCDPKTMQNRWFHRMRERASTPGSSIPCPLKLSAVAHFHYPDVWDEFRPALRALPAGTDIHITLTPNASGLADSISREFPQAVIHRIENRGRDILPFLRLLKAGAFAEADIVLKIHGKRSDHGSGLIVGDYWRRACLSALCGSPSLVRDIVGKFESDPTLGMVGPARFRLPNRKVDDAGAMGVNEPSIRRLFEQIFGTTEGLSIDFFAGTMFWFRREALEALNRIEDPELLFAREDGILDGLPEHAFERLLPMVARKSGFGVIGVDD